ncbi:putative F-box protein-like isoform X2 [Capsicum annuum]|nr:putative F-box protein-like isoform X2 [Capsicum annuum]KAF3639102.1 putative F-box protein-like isoform X2 [Capsicum annuum]
MTCFSDCETPNACNEQPSKKKISVTQRKRSSIEEGEEKGNCATIDYFNKLSADSVLPSFSPQTINRKCPQLLFMEKNFLHRSERSRLRFVSVDMDGSTEELYTATVPDGQLACSTMQVCYDLVCLPTDCRAYLCNPAMQQLCELPKCSPSATPGYYHLGFGYLQSRKDIFSVGVPGVFLANFSLLN